MSHYYFSPNNGLFHGIFAHIKLNIQSKFNQYVKIETSKPLDTKYQTFQDIFPPYGYCHSVFIDVNGSTTFTFTNFFVKVHSYSIKLSPNPNRTFFEWKLEGSNDLNGWKEIHYMKNCEDCAINNEKNYALDHEVFNSFKLTKYRPNNDGTYYIDLYGFEIFGEICSPFHCGITYVCTNHHYHHFSTVYILIFMIK